MIHLLRVGMKNNMKISKKWPNRNTRVDNWWSKGYIWMMFKESRDVKMPERLKVMLIFDFLVENII